MVLLFPFELLALRSLASPASSSPSSKLKLKRLGPGLVELSSAPERKSMETDAAPAIDLAGEPKALLATDFFSQLWPITSINGSNSMLLCFETLLSSLLGPSVKKEGSFKLLKADVSAHTFVKIGFRVDKRIREGEEYLLEGFPEWRTKPQTVAMHFEVLAKVDGNKMVPEKVLQVDPVIEDSVAPNVLMENITMSSIPIVYQPLSPFTLLIFDPIIFSANHYIIYMIIILHLFLYIGSTFKVYIPTTSEDYFLKLYGLELH